MNDAALKVVTVTHSVSRRAGGLFTSVRRLVQNLNALGLPVDVLGLSDGDTHTDAKHWAPVTPRTYDSFPPAELGFAPGLHAAVQRAARDGAVLHLHGLWKMTSMACARAGRAFHAPVIVSPRGMLDAWALRQSPVKKRLGRMLYENRNLRSAECIHALCEAERRQIRAFGILGPVAVIPNGVDIPSPVADARDNPIPEAWRGRRICLFLSRVHPKKGLLPLVEAFSTLHAFHDEWLLAIAGPDDAGHARAVHALIRDMELTAHVRLLGPLFGDTKDAWLRHADAFVLPSLSEGFPMALLEALAYNLPILMTPACNFPEAQAAGAAFVAEPTVDGLTTGLREMMSSSAATLEKMGSRGRRLVAKQYTWPTIAAHMIDVYEWIAGRGAMPASVFPD